MEFFDAMGQGVAMEPAELQTVIKTADAVAVRHVPPSGKSRARGARSDESQGAGGTGERLYLPIQAVSSWDDAHADVRCRASVAVEKAGVYKLHVLMQPQHVPLIGSPIVLHVSPAPAAAATSFVLASTKEKRMRAGQTRTFKVSAPTERGR